MNKQTKCDHKYTRIEHNVGSDIWEEGSCEQHEEICLNCGKTRIIADVQKFDGHKFRSTGKWSY